MALELRGLGCGRFRLVPSNSGRFRRRPIGDGREIPSLRSDIGKMNWRIGGAFLRELEVEDAVWELDVLNCVNFNFPVFPERDYGRFGRQIDKAMPAAKPAHHFAAPVVVQGLKLHSPLPPSHFLKV